MVCTSFARDWIWICTKNFKGTPDSSTNTAPLSTPCEGIGDWEMTEGDVAWVGSSAELLRCMSFEGGSNESARSLPLVVEYVDDSIGVSNAIDFLFNERYDI